MDVAARLETIERENEQLRDRIAQLEALLFESERLPLELRLTTHEEALVAFLLKRNEVSKDQILTAIYGLLPDDDEPELKIIDVYVCKARKKLAPFGLQIKTIWGRGYCLPPATKTTLRAMMPTRAAPAA